VAAERRVRTIEHPDGKARLFITERDDGRRRFEGEAEIIGDGDEEVYSAPRDISGLYESAEAAEQAARRDVPWLRDRIAT
jgi:hypothetical protein